MIELCVHVQVMEGYGQTECTAGVTFQMPYETEAGHVGPPLPCNLVKLVDVPEMDYYVKDQRGEVRKRFKDSGDKHHCN